MTKVAINEKTSFSILKRYLQEEEIEKFLNSASKESRFFIDDYYWWFKATNFLKIDPNEETRTISQKLSIRLIISFSLIEELYPTSHGERLIFDFFSKLKKEEKFLMVWLIEVRSPIWGEMSIPEAACISKEKRNEIIKKRKEESERIEKERKDLVSSLISKNSSELIDDKFSELIHYLYAWRSQIVHRGGGFCVSTRFIGPISGIRKVVYIAPYPSKKIEAKILNFRDFDYGLNFEQVFEDLIFISFLRQNNLFLKEEFEKEWKETFKSLLRKIQNLQEYDVLKFREMDTYLNNIN